MKILNICERNVIKMIAIGSDHGGFKLKEEIKKYLEEKKIEYNDIGCYSEESVDYPNIAKEVALKVSMVANKFKGIRCAKCNNEEEAKFSKMHNDSNIITIGADYVSTEEAIRIIRMWIATPFEGGRHSRRVDMIKEIENENMK